MLRVLIAVLLFTGCPAKTFDRRLDKSLEADIQWQQYRESNVKRDAKKDERKRRKVVRRTPVVSESGLVVTLPDGQPVYSVTETTEDSDTSTSTKTAAHGGSSSKTGVHIDGSTSSRDSEKLSMWQPWILRIAGILVVLGVVTLGYYAIRLKWIRGWFF